MVSCRLGEVLFKVYPQDHEPRHVHGFIGSAEVIVDLLADGSVALADRVDAIRPANAKRRDIRRVLNEAAENFEQLAAAWEQMHAE